MNQEEMNLEEMNPEEMSQEEMNPEEITTLQGTHFRDHVMIVGRTLPDLVTRGGTVPGTISEGKALLL